MFPAEKQHGHVMAVLALGMSCAQHVQLLQGSLT